MNRQSESERRRELADFVRAGREKLMPQALGLPGGERRRTPGLRREEVAQLSGLSVTWYTWLEQGRDVSLSPNALARLARTLGLRHAERAYLFELAGRRDPEPGGSESEAAPAAVLASVEQIGCPAYILDRLWNALAWNAAAARLFVGWLDRPGERNLLRYIFLDAAARELIVDHAERARRVVAEFRLSAGAHLDDPAVRGLVDALARQSPDFARLWEAHLVLGREGGKRVFRHPDKGVLRYEQVTFDLAGRPDLKLAMLVPDGKEPLSAAPSAG